MTIAELKTKFDNILTSLNATPSVNFSNMVEAGFEALGLARVIQEYAAICGGVRSIVHPGSNKFLMESPGRLARDRLFEAEFTNNKKFVFSTDVEVFGLNAIQYGPSGTLFEADIVVIEEKYVDDILNNFDGYPAPQHLDSVYECKFGKYKKSHLREFLGLRRHLSYLKAPENNTMAGANLFGNATINSNPRIAMRLFRPRTLNFYDARTSELFDLYQVQIN